MNTFWVHKNWQWRNENATAKYIDQHCEEAVTLADAQATVEALQRERDEWREKATHRGKVAHDLQTQLTEWHTKYVGLHTALDAERELSAAWAEKARQYELELDGDPQNFHGQGRTTGLREQLSQLQALVRAYCGAKVAFDDGRLREDHHAWKERFNKLELAEAALIDYTMRTLDATTPAAGQMSQQDVDEVVQEVMSHPKRTKLEEGGDGE